MILIELNGERQLVESLDGCAGCTVIERDVDEPPSHFAKREGGQWTEDGEAKRKAGERARLNVMSREELAEHILSEARKGQK